MLGKRLNHSWLFLFVIFFSGFCGLVYELIWMKELKLIFGFSTASSAAVLAAFSLGLGVGAKHFGRVADSSPTPLLSFAKIELSIGIFGIISFLAIKVLQEFYGILGGTFALGLISGTGVRILFSLIVIGIPAFFMGGTLPFAMRYFQTNSDQMRIRSSIIYGLNTLGAVIGCFCITFILFEKIGLNYSLCLAVIINIFIALTAYYIHTENYNPYIEPPELVNKVKEEMKIIEFLSPRIIAIFAFISGFIFFTMELVWYRMLNPLLGGSVYTFGLILMVALLGIGVGGVLYAIVSPKIKSYKLLLVYVWLGEAVFLAIPFLLGDNFAYSAFLLRSYGYLGFSGLVGGWAILAFIAVFPVGVCSGIQFPLLLKLIGEGNKDIGSQVGYVYVANMLGSLFGSLFTGFILFPYFNAVNTWRMCVIILFVMSGVASVFISYKQLLQFKHLIIVVLCGLVVSISLFYYFPTAAWRNSGIGGGRAQTKAISVGKNDIQEWINGRNQIVLHETDGVESSLYIEKTHGLSFSLNGKNDGNTHLDTATQIGLGILPGLVHPNAKKILVIGLGTGSTAGWLASIPGVEKVDVIEMEPKIIEFAAMCSAVNANALSNPKVNIIIGDAREYLTTSKEQYDIIASEPSNPYRAGIASLFTQEFYSSVKDRLLPGGLFVNWVQGYELDSLAISSVFATLKTSFKDIDLWFGAYNDLLIMASRNDLSYDLSLMQTRLKRFPWREGVYAAWNTFTLEGVFSHFIGNSLLSSLLAEKGGKFINTDNLNYLEFWLAKVIGKLPRQDLVSELLDLAIKMSANKPKITANIDLNYDRVMEQLRWYKHIESRMPIELGPWQGANPEALQRLQALQSVTNKVPDASFLQLWQKQTKAPESPIELTTYYLAKALQGTLQETELLNSVWEVMPAEKKFILALFYSKKGDLNKSIQLAFEALKVLKETSFMSQEMADNLFKFTELITINSANTDKIIEYYNLLSTPFAAYAYESTRKNMQLDVIIKSGLWKKLCVEALAGFEPWVNWSENFLSFRVACYKENNHSLLPSSSKQYAEFKQEELLSVSDLIKL